MTYQLAARDHEARLAAGPYIEVPAETCQGIGGRHELEDDVVTLTFSTWNDATKRYDERTEFICASCFREKLQAHVRTAKDYEIADFPWDNAETAARCSDCHFWRCECER